MKFSVQRESLLKPLQQVIGAVERRQTLPALANILLRSDDSGISLTATDLEVELQAHLDMELSETGETTLPARKLLDICRTLPESAVLDFDIKADRSAIKSGRSRFSLATLPASDFPTLDELDNSQQLTLSQNELKSLIERTAFAMAQQDVRYYLNGLMLELTAKNIKAVATDGHRLAMCEIPFKSDLDATRQVIIPRKGVMELQRLLENNDDLATIDISNSHIRVTVAGLRFTSKLIDGRFPDYNKVLPKSTDKEMSVDKELFKQALTRTSILSNEKYRGIRLSHEKGSLKLQAHNPEHEEAEEIIEIDYKGEPLEIGFNVTYLLDALSTISSKLVDVKLKDANSSALVMGNGDETARYVVMPMRL